MASQGLVSLQEGIAEVRELQAAAVEPAASASPAPLALDRAVGRASVVLLSSHLEGYIDSVNLEATAVVNNAGVHGGELARPLRLIHSKPAVEGLVGASWEGDARARLLGEFIQTDAWLWAGEQVGSLEPDRLLMWMKSPHPRALVKYFRMWGVEDIFSRITRAQQTRDELWRRLQELVEKRNSIAHGDLGTSATYADVGAYMDAVDTFSSRSDAVLAQRLARICSADSPW